MPESVTDHRDRTGRRGIPLIGRESRTRGKSHSEDVEEISRDGGAPNTLRRTLTAREADGGRGVSGHAVEGALVPREVLELEVRESRRAPRRLLIERDALQADEPVRVVHRGRSQQNGIHEAEDRGVRADTQCEGEARRGAQTGSRDQVTDGQGEIAHGDNCFS